MFEARTEYHWGRVMRCYAERPPTVDAMFRQTVARASDAEAVVDGGIRIDYRELDARVDRVAAGLAARGVRADDRVAVMLDNRVEAVITVLAISRLGAVLVSGTGAWHATSEAAEVRSTVGAGDAMLAGFLRASASGAAALRSAVAYGTAAVGLAGSK